MVENSVINLVVLPEHVPGQDGPGLSVKELFRYLLHPIQRYSVPAAQSKMFLQRQVLGAVVEDGRPAQLLHICAPAPGQLNRRFLGAPDMGDALGLDHGVGYTPEILYTQTGKVDRSSV